jgi:hypothetical protein
MKCPYREGEKKCTWWIKECLNPCISLQIKKACNGQITRCEYKENNGVKGDNLSTISQ